MNEEGDTEKEDQVVYREDFWTSTSNKQLNFVQHIYTLLKVDGRAGVVLPDNVLFEGGAGERVRRNLLEKCRVHTLLRLPTGIWYSPGGQGQRDLLRQEGGPGGGLDRPPVGLRPAHQHALHAEAETDPARKDFDEFVECYKPGRMHERVETWSEDNPDGRWRCYDYEELLKRDKLSLDLFWIKDESLTDTDSLPAPGVIAAEIANDLEAALEQFTRVAERLGETDASLGSILKFARKAGPQSPRARADARGLRRWAGRSGFRSGPAVVRPSPCTRSWRRVRPHHPLVNETRHSRQHRSRSAPVLAALTAGFGGRDHRHRGAYGILMLCFRAAFPVRGNADGAGPDRRGLERCADTRPAGPGGRASAHSRCRPSFLRAQNALVGWDQPLLLSPMEPLEKLAASGSPGPVSSPALPRCLGAPSPFPPRGDGRHHRR